MKFIHFIIIIILTVITQIGGVLYLATILIFKKHNRLKKGLIFIALYLLFTFIFIPLLAPVFGRIKIQNSDKIENHSFATKFLNRNYVTKELHEVLTNVSLQISEKYPGIKIIYLDANFPFINKFPLLPHLSHNDGKKIDITFIYEDKNKNISNLKPSRSGYGIFEEPTTKEINQANICKKNNYWQYDFTKHLTFGELNSNLNVSTKVNKELIQIITESKLVSKIFIEPHLNGRFKVNSSKIRFHGCKAVRHDDHIHFQVK